MSPEAERSVAATAVRRTHGGGTPGAAPDGEP